MTSSEPTKEEILERLTALEEENEKLREENKRLKAKLRWYEGPIHHQARTNLPTTDGLEKV
jgi:cell division protein FtsB